LTKNWLHGGSDDCRDLGRLDCDVAFSCVWSSRARRPCVDRVYTPCLMAVTQVARPCQAAGVCGRHGGCLASLATFPIASFEIAALQRACTISHAFIRRSLKFVGCDLHCIHVVQASQGCRSRANGFPITRVRINWSRAGRNSKASLHQRWLCI
jgi:hypothetical protein